MIVRIFNINYRSVIGILLSVISLHCSSQGLEIKEFKQNLNDGSAFHAPMDSNGNPCGLVKVRSDNTDLQFSGAVVGDVENKLNEYWVYLPKGCRQLQVLHPNLMPLVVKFEDYGIEAVDSKATYVLTLRDLKLKKEKNELVLTIKPESAKLEIDDILVNNLSGGGYYLLYLPKGDHLLRIMQEGYRTLTQVLSSGKGTQSLDVELESVMAELHIDCKTETVTIYVDGELKGNGSWMGYLLPGTHQVEARQTNFETQKQTVQLEEKESRTLTIPELIRSKGRVKIVTSPSNLPVELDGVNVGISPTEVEIESGEHYLKCNAFGCLPYRSNIEVNSGETFVADIKLEYNKDNVFAEYYPKAYQGNIDAMRVLAINRMLKEWRSGAENIEEAVFWRERIEGINKQYFSSPTERSSSSVNWLWTYEALGDECRGKGLIERAIYCYQKCLSLDVEFDEYTDSETKEYKTRISEKLKALR